jgi:hypothetical protein
MNNNQNLQTTSPWNPVRLTIPTVAHDAQNDESPVNTGLLKYRYRDSNCPGGFSLGNAQARSARKHWAFSLGPHRSRTLKNAPSNARLSQDCPKIGR